MSTLPPGYHAPLAVVNANDHGAYVIITGAFGLVVILITLGIRIWIREKVSPPYGLDDWVIFGATALSILQTVLVFAQIHDGFGKSIGLIADEHLLKVQQLVYATDLLYIISLYLSKLSVVLLFKRISSGISHNKIAWAQLSGCATFGVISVLLIAMRCNLVTPWLQYKQSSCGALPAQWAAVVALDIITELALFGLSLNLVWGLQTGFGRKARVVSAFGLRLPVIALAAVRYFYVDQELNSSNPTLAGVPAAVLTQVELYYAIIAATIPCLRPFLAGFVTNYGAMGGDTVIGGSQVGNSSGRNGKSSGTNTKGSFAMGSMLSKRDSVANEHATRRKQSRTMRRPDGPLTLSEVLRPDRVDNHTSVTHGTRSHAQSSDRTSIASSNDSTKMIITKEVQWHVDSEGGRAESEITDMEDGRMS